MASYSEYVKSKKKSSSYSEYIKEHGYSKESEPDEGTLKPLEERMAAKSKNAQKSNANSKTVTASDVEEMAVAANKLRGRTGTQFSSFFDDYVQMKHEEVQKANETVESKEATEEIEVPVNTIKFEKSDELTKLYDEMNGAPDEQRTQLLNDYIRQNTGTKGAQTFLQKDEWDRASAWEREKANYQQTQAAEKAAAGHIPVAAEEAALMSDDELKADLKNNQFASEEMTKRYKDRFYSMSNEERKLVAQINAFDEGYNKDGGARMNAAAELKNKYNYTNDDITAMVYFYNRYANKEKAKQEDINARVAMEQHPFLESLASVPKGVAGGAMAAVGIADSAIDNKKAEKIGITDQGLDYNNEFSKLQRQAQSGRDEFTDTHDLMIGDYDVGDMLYNTAMSGLESGAAAFVPGGAAAFVPGGAAAFVPGGAAILGVNAATAKANELSQRGLSSDQAIIGGVAAGTFEALFEKVSIGNIKALQEVDAKTFKDVAFNIAKSMGVNFAEEAATEFANIAYDTIAHGDKSEWQMQMNELVTSGGMSEQEAFKEVLKGSVLQVIEAGASGALMGAGFGAAGAGSSYIANRANLANAGTMAEQNEQTGAIIAEGQAAPEGSNARKLADKLAAKQEKGENVSDYNIGLLQHENSQQGRVSEGTFAGIGSQEELRTAYEDKLREISMTERYSEGDNKFEQLYKDRQVQKERDRLYDEYKAAEKQLEKSKGREEMQEAFSQRLQDDIKNRAESERLKPEIKTADGKAAKLDGSGIFKTADGQNAVKTEDGKVHNVTDITFGDENVQRLYDATEGMTAESANLFISEYNGETVAEYKRAFDYYYRMGRTGMSAQNIRNGDNLFSGILSEDAQAKIAEAGLKGREFRKGFTDLSAARKNERFRYESKVLQAVGEKRNLEFIILDESQRDNGYHLSGTNRIVIYRNADGRLLLRTAGHEAFHFIKNQAKDEAGKADVKALEDFVLDALKKNGMDIEAEIERLGLNGYESREDCIEEIVADSMFDVFTNEKFTRKLFDENRSLFEKVAKKVKEIIADIKAAISMLGNSDAEIRALKDDAESLEKINAMFDSLLEKAGESYRKENENGQKNNTAGAVKNVKFSYKGKASDGRSIYKTNYIKGTPKATKQQDLIGLVQNVWSKKPITLTIFRNGKAENIVARFNPELTERSDLSKIVFGNRKGNASDQRITLDLASDFYQIAEESKYVKSKAETGKDNPAHDGVFNWEYFVTNLIYRDENDVDYDCHMNIDVKEKSDGHYFYSFAIEKGTAPQTLLAVVTDESATVPIDSIPEIKKSVKKDLSSENLSELKEKRDSLTVEYRELRAQIDEIKTSDEYKAFDNEVRTVRKNGSLFGVFEAVKKIRERKKQWADASGLSKLEEKYYEISEQIHDYDLEIYKAEKTQKEALTAAMSEKVKNFSVNDVEKYVSAAEKRFGTTTKFDNAGYLTSSGKLLDFSDGQGYRVKDHREIRDVLDFLPENSNYSDGLVQFMNMGNIRMQIGGIDVAKAPNEKQIPVLRKFFNENNGEITVDFSKENGDNAGSIEYPKGTSSTRILNDIKKYFETGEIPQISNTAAFHSMFSTKKTTPIQAYWAETVKENHSFRNILSLLDEMQLGGGKIQLDSKGIDRIARDIIKNTSSRYDRNRLLDELTVLFDYMANSKNVDTEEIFSSVLTIAHGVLEKSEMKDTELYEQYKNVREYLCNQYIYITPAVKKEIESQFGDYKSFRNILMGKMMHLSTTDTSAMTLDEAWQELSELAPEYFPKDMNELDMPMQLTAFFESIAPKVVNPYEHFRENIEDAAAELATEIFQKYYEVGRLETTQEKYKNLVFENMRKLERNKKEMRRNFKNKVAEIEQKNFEDYRQRVTEYKQQREAGDRRRRLRNELERNYNYINRRLIRETDNDHIPENLKPVVSAFKFIVPDSNSTFSKSRFTEFENEYRMLEEKSSLFDADIAERISALRERLTPGIGAPRMRELDLFELEELRNISEHVKFIVQTENKLFSERNKGRVEDFAKAVLNDLEEKKDSDIQDVPQFKYRGKMIDKAKNKFDAFIKGLTKPEYLFSSLGSEKMKDLFDELRRGENTETKIIFEAKEAEERIKAENHYDPRWESEMITLNLRGGALKITVEQAMALYATSKRKQGLEHMLGGGVVLYSSEKSKNTKGKDIEKIKRSTRRFAEEDITILQKSLSADQKKYTDAMVEYITKVIGSKRNEVALRLNGIEKYKETYYFPVKVDRHFIDKSVGRQEVVSTIRNQSSTKRTVEHAQNPIEITGFTETVNNHIYDSALYCAYVLPISDFKKVYNFRDKIPAGEGAESLIFKDVSVQNELRRANGINAMKQIDDFMVALDSGSRYENIIPISAELMSKAKKVAVMANLSVVVQQPTAVFRAMLYINPKYFATWANKADIAEMKRWNGCALKKEIGYFDVNMGRTATDYMNEYLPDKSVKKDWSFGDKVKNGNIMLKVDQIAGWGAEKADEMTWGAIWNACKKQTKAQNPELSGNALCKAAAELFQETISKTQVYDSVFAKPDYMRRKEGFAMMATQFMSEPLTSLNMLTEAVVNAHKAKGSEQKKAASKFCVRAFACYVTSVVANSAIKSIIQSIRDDDEENSFLEKYVSNLVEGIATEQLGMIPYVKDILSIVQGYDLERADVAVFTTFADAVKTISNPDKSTYEKVAAIMKAAGQASGIPFYNVVRDTKAVLGVMQRITNGAKNGFEPTTGKGVLNELKETFGYLPGVEEPSGYEQLTEAYISGDKKHFDKVYSNLIAEKSESAIESGIKKTVKDKFIDGEYTDTEAQSILADVLGMESDDIHWLLDEWNTPLGEGETYSKYADLVTAVESGENLESIIEEYTAYGVENKTLASEITKRFKDKYIELYKSDITEARKLESKLLNAYAALGKDKSEKKKDIAKWLKD